MPYSNKFTQLKQEYVAERNLDVSDDQFAALVYTFPSILVANADGRIDKDEKSFMKRLPDTLMEGYEEELHDNGGATTVYSTMSPAYFAEVSYLVSNLGKWKAKFLETLKEQLHDSINERNAIFEMMWRTADSSEDISEEERKQIEEISAILDL